jgi:TPR repeat protein
MHPISRIAFATLLFLPATLPGFAQSAPPEVPTSNESTPLPEMAAVEQAWKRGDFVFVRSALLRLATEVGTPLAQYRYGRALLEGRGGPRDLNGAAKWLQKAVDQDHLPATTLLARLHLSAPDEQRDAATAATLLTSAAARGDAEAQYYLGLLVSAGDGLPKDEAAAVNWFLAAAEQQHVAAQYSLSRAYAKGAGTTENPAKALRWLQEAGSSGHAEAQFYLALAYDRGQGVAENQNEALRWYRAAAEAGHMLSQRILGTRYLQGDGVEKNLNEALRWLNAAAEAGEPGAMSNLGYLYASGTGVEIDNVAAATWYARAADRGIGGAMLALGRFHETGRGVDQDIVKALALYQQAAAQDTPGATAQLAAMSLVGTLDGLIAPQQMVPWMAAEAQDGNADAEAWLSTRAEADMRPAQTALALLQLQRGDAVAGPIALLEQAATAGDPQAQLQLGKLYTIGTGVALDYVLAHKWLNVAAASGVNAAAQQRDLVAKLMTPEHVAEAQTAARIFFDGAAARMSAPQQTEQANQ